MHRDLEALIQAYDAALEAGSEEAADQRDQFERSLKEVLLRLPSLSEESLRNMVRLAHGRWVAQQQKQPPTLPPKA